MKFRKLLFPVALASTLVVFNSQSLSAASLQWDVNGNAAGLGGTGAWDTTSAFWDTTASGANDGTDATAAYTFTNADKAIFAGTAGTVTLGTGVTVNALQIDTAAYVITGNTLTLAGTTPTITANANAMLSSVLAGAAAANSVGLVKAGTGVLSLSGNNTYTGLTSVSAGALRVAHSAALGTGAAASNYTTVTNGAALQIGALDGTTSLSVSERFFINGTGVSNDGAIRNISASNTLTANWYLGAVGARINSDAGTLTMSGQLTSDATYTGAGGLTIGGAGNVVLSGINAVAAATLVKDGGGTLTTSGSFTFANTATVNAGTLLASKAATFASYSTAGKVIFNGGTVGVVMGDGTTGWTTLQVDTLLSNATKTAGALGIDTTNGNLTQWAAFTTTNLGSSLGLAKLGTNTLTLDQTNNYTGTTTVGAGTLQIANRVSLYNATTSSWTDTNIVVNSGAMLALNVGGTGQFTASDLDIIKGLGTAAGGLKNGSILGIDTSGITAGFTYTPAIGNTNSGANVIGLNKLGANTLTLSATNTYTGGTTVTAGTLTLGHATDTLSDSGAVTISGGTLALGTNNDTVGAVTLGSGSITGTTGVLTGSSFAVQSGTISALLSGSANLSKTTTGIVTLSGTNNYTGTTTVSAGRLQLTYRASLYNATTTDWTTTNITVNTGATLGLNVGGANQFTAADLDIIKGLGTATSGFMNGSFLGLDTSAVSAGFTYSSAIGNTNGGANVIGLIKTGGNKLTLSGTNTYTGGTSITNGSVDVSGDQSAANGGWAIDGTLTGSTGANFLAGSTVSVASGKSVSIYAGSASGRAPFINVAGTVTCNGTLSVQRDGNLNIQSAGAWTQNGSMSVSAGSSTSFTSNMSVSGSFIYAGTAAIGFNTGSSGSSNLTVNGGVFTTGKNFNTPAGSGGTSSLTLSNGGSIKLSADIAQLVTTAGSAFNVSLGTGGGKIDTNGFSTTVDRVISGAGSLTKQGAGTLTLSGANTYGGTTTINGGTLALGASNVLPDTALSLGAATLNAATFTDTLGTLDPTAAATINFGTGATLVFADSSSVDWTGGTLALTGSFVSGSSLKFGSGPGALTADQLAKISAPGFTSFSLNASGYLVGSTGSGYDSWSGPSGYNLTGNDALRGSDPDKDGFTNLQEFLFGTAPNANNGSLVTTTSTGSTLVIRWKQRTANATYQLKQSSTLGNDWTNSSATVEDDGAASGDYQPKKATITPGAGKLFFRVEGVEN